MNNLYNAWINENGGKTPATVSIEPTIRCNMRCPMCDRTHKEDFQKHQQNEMSTKLLLNNIKVIKVILKKNGVNEKHVDYIRKRILDNIAK